MRKSQPLQLLEALSKEYKKSLHPTVPPEYIPATKYSDRTANGLTKMAIDFIRLSGGQSERINRTPRPIDNRKEVTDCLGRTRVIGSVHFVKSGGTNGTADIAATMQGRSVKIEIKVGKDRQSDAQKQYQQQIEAAGGIYIIARSFEDFYTQWNSIFPGKA